MGTKERRGESQACCPEQREGTAPWLWGGPPPHSSATHARSLSPGYAMQLRKQRLGDPGTPPHVPLMPVDRWSGLEPAALCQRPHLPTQQSLEDETGPPSGGPGTWAAFCQNPLYFPKHVFLLSCSLCPGSPSSRQRGLPAGQIPQKRAGRWPPRAEMGCAAGDGPWPLCRDGPPAWQHHLLSGVKGGVEGSPPGVGGSRPCARPSPWPCCRPGC